jgi:hypothetical protein
VKEQSMDISKIIEKYVNDRRTSVAVPGEKRATAWEEAGGCWHRNDATTGRRVGWVYPAPGRPEWSYEVDFGTATVFDGVEPDTAEAQKAEVDRLLLADGWELL